MPKPSRKPAPVAVPPIAFTLQGLKHAKFASQETRCFEAIVCMDGVPSFHASNQGHGGCDSQHPLRGQSPAAFVAALKRAEDWCRAQPTERYFGMDLPVTLDGVVGDLINRHVQTADLKRMLASKAVLVEGNQVSSIGWPRLKAAQFTDKHWAYVRAKAPLATILNQLPFEQALQLYVDTGKRRDAEG